MHPPLYSQQSMKLTDRKKFPLSAASENWLHHLSDCPLRDGKTTTGDQLEAGWRSSVTACKLKFEKVV